MAIFEFDSDQVLFLIYYAILSYCWMSTWENYVQRAIKI